jgi:HSP20 family molecular chaperone IbpA
MPAWIDVLVRLSRAPVVSIVSTCSSTHGYEHPHEDRVRTDATAWVLATDIFARNGDLVIRIEVAGQRPEDVDVTFSQGILTVSGRRSTEEDTGGGDSFYIRERFHGAFRRAITLPPDTDDTQIMAEFFNGLVGITVRGGVSGAGHGGSPSRTGRPAPSPGLSADTATGAAASPNSHTRRTLVT